MNSNHIGTVQRFSAVSADDQETSIMPAIRNIFHYYLNVIPRSRHSEAPNGISGAIEKNERLKFNP